MRVLALVAALSAAISAQAYITTSTEWADLCYAEVTTKPATKTMAGVTVTETESGTAYTTKTDYVYYTGAAKRSYPPARRAAAPEAIPTSFATTIVVINECHTTSTYTYTPTSTVYNPASTTTTSVSTTTITDITTYTLCAPGNLCG
ncbi:hypothetical protein DL93DRAFT_2086289 [Clavulina sp. PMI_390]|nr:hypothetical protein DL93DRAFT_2086289 [Clavulina sp. PMI_390]